jgi:hypothetical protein
MSHVQQVLIIDGNDAGNSAALRTRELAPQDNSI